MILEGNKWSAISVTRKVRNGYRVGKKVELCKVIKTLYSVSLIFIIKSCFLLLGSHLPSREVIHQHAHHSVDFRGEAITFKATTAGILATLSHCMEVLAQREEAWRRKCEREMEKRRRAEEMLKEVSKEADTRRRVVLVGGPDYEVRSCILGWSGSRLRCVM